MFHLEKNVIVIIDGDYLRSSFINYLYYIDMNFSLNIKKFNRMISNDKMFKGYIIIKETDNWSKFAENGYVILNDMI